MAARSINLMIGRYCVFLVIAALYASVWIGTVSIGAQASRLQTEPTATGTVAFQSASKEYLWYEAENMRGITETARHEPQLNPSYLEIPAAKAPGWSISGPGVSAEWSQGGESEWNSVAASADETRGGLWQNVEVPRAGEYKLWVRYADWAGKSENFLVRVMQQDHEVFRREFGSGDVIDPHDETSSYWGWSFAWDSAPATLAKGPARILIEIEKSAEARRQVDCFLITNDLAYVPNGRSKPDFAAMRYLREFSSTRSALSPMIEAPALR